MVNNTNTKDTLATPQQSSPTQWTLFTDGASSVEGSGEGLIITDPEGQEIIYALRFNFKTSNKEAEYEALIAGIVLTIQMEVQHLHVYTDSLLIANRLKDCTKQGKN